MCVYIWDTTSAFTLPATSPALNRETATLLEAEKSKRRDLFNTMKRIFVGSAVAYSSKEAAIAAEDSTAGRIVDIEVANLDGESGKVGKIRIQLRPEWAPRGVARFEVRFWRRL